MSKLTKELDFIERHGGGVLVMGRAARLGRVKSTVICDTRQYGEYADRGYLIDWAATIAAAADHESRAALQEPQP